MAGTEPGMICWADVETTGLDVNHDHLLSIALLLMPADAMDADLSAITELVVRHDRLVPDRPLTDFTTMDAVVDATSLSEAHLRRHPCVESAYAVANQYVRDMHISTGLWERLSGPEAVPLHGVDARIVQLLDDAGVGPKEVAIGGNSLQLDLNVIDTFLPGFAARRHHHFIDVTGLSVTMERRGFGARTNSPTMEGPKHDARVDIGNCVVEYLWRNHQLEQAAQLLAGSRQV